MPIGSEEVILISREDARARGLKLYCTGDRCWHGHIDERYVNNGQCVSCVREARRLWKPKQPKEISASEQARQKLNRRIYRKENKEAFKERQRIRRRLTAGGPMRHTSIALHEFGLLFTVQEGRCMGCYHLFSDSKKVTIDHIIPFAEGGEDHWLNVQLLCSSCNGSKGIKTNAQWVLSPTFPGRQLGNEMHPLMWRYYVTDEGGPAKKPLVKVPPGVDIFKHFVMVPSKLPKVGTVWEDDPVQMSLFSLDTPPPPVS